MKQKYLYKTILFIFFIYSFGVYATDPNEYIGGVDGYGGSAFNPNYIGNGMTINTVRDQLTNPVPSMASSSVTTIQGYLVTVRQDSGDTNNDTPRINLNNSNELQTLIDKILNGTWDDDFNDNFNVSEINNIVLMNTSINPYTLEEVATFAVYMENQALPEPYTTTINRVPDYNPGTQQLITTVRQFEIIIRSIQNAEIHVEGGNVFYNNPSTNSAVMIPSQFVHVSGGSVTLSYEPDNNHEDDDTNPDNDSDWVYEYYYAIPKDPADVSPGEDSPAFMSALNNYKNASALTLSLASFIIRTYIDVVIPSVAGNGRAAHIRSVIARVAKYYHTDFEVAEQMLINYMTDPACANGALVQNFRFDADNAKEATFLNKVKDIVASNGIIAALLTRFSNNNVKLVFNVGPLNSNPGKLTLAETNPHDPTGETFFITFNSDLDVISQNGDWVQPKDFTGPDKLIQSLTNTIAHEAMHAKHYAIFQEALRENENRTVETYNWLLSRYSQEFVNIFFKMVNGQPRTNTPQEILDNDHAFMDQYNTGVNTAVENELDDDIANGCL